MNFQESVEYLYSLGNEVLAMKLGLASTERLLAALGDPQKNFLKVQIAGTNGKGSTAAFLDAICRRAGIKTGLYTSPHLISITERIRIGGREIGEEDFARRASRVREVSEKLVETGEIEFVPTFFEQVTAIAVSAFSEAKVDLAILETGLGGRLDAVTATRAEIVVLTPIDFDHQNVLGNTLAEIAAEKAAVIRADTKVIVAPQKKAAERVVLGKCLESLIEPIWTTPDIKIKKDIANGFGYELFATFKTLNDNYPNVMLGLAGRHQFINASVAISAAETLRDFGFQITSDDIWAGLQNAEHRGRLEFYEGILFDGAHNAAGASALREYLDEFVALPVTLVFGAMRDKDLCEIAAILFPRAANLVLTVPDNPRSVNAGDLLKFVPENFDRDKVFLTESVSEALKTARALTAEGGLICVTGSLYLVGEAQAALQKTF